MSEARPVGQSELPGLFGAWASLRRVALAVSGGADSVALMTLAAEWRQLQGEAPALLVLTVDHRLRAGSAEDAAWVAREADARGLPHRTLVWRHDAVALDAGLQARARSARYRLLAEAVRLEDCDALATAHHQADQAETVLMRLARGSGVDGLAAMRPRSLVDGIVLLRPLLALPKARLVATLRATGCEWREDPSNTRLEFERVRLRDAAPALRRVGLDAPALSASARRLARAADALEQATDRLAEAAVELDGVLARVDATRLDAAPEEIRVRLLARLIAAFGGTARPPRLSELERLAARVFGHPCADATLGGSVVRRRGAGMTICRESGRMGLPEARLSGSESLLWDRRFCVSVPKQVLARGQSLVVRALGAAATRDIRRAVEVGAGRGGTKLAWPAEAVHGLPGLWTGGRLLGLPRLASHAVAAPAASLPDPALCWIDAHFVNAGRVWNGRRGEGR
jgi:tRNA(Ile)-lysidine synthase